MVPSSTTSEGGTEFWSSCAMSQLSFHNEESRKVSKSGIDPIGILDESCDLHARCMHSSDNAGGDSSSMVNILGEGGDDDTPASNGSARPNA